MVMTQCLALELAPKIRVNTIVLGLVATEETEQRFALNAPEMRRWRENTIPLRRLGHPEDVCGRRYADVVCRVSLHSARARPRARLHSMARARLVRLRVHKIG